MPLNHEVGEYLEDRDIIYRVVPVEKYKEQSRLLTPVEETTGTKFKRAVVVNRPIFEVAWNYAMNAFMRSGAPSGALNCDILCQEYPRTKQVAFIFAAIVKGQEMYVPTAFQLTNEQVADLMVRNLWEPYTAPAVN